MVCAALRRTSSKQRVGGGRARGERREGGRERKGEWREREGGGGRVA